MRNLNEFLNENVKDALKAERDKRKNISRVLQNYLKGKNAYTVEDNLTDVIRAIKKSKPWIQSGNANLKNAISILSGLPLRGDIDKKTIRELEKLSRGFTFYPGDNKDLYITNSDGEVVFFKNTQLEPSMYDSQIETIVNTAPEISSELIGDNTKLYAIFKSDMNKSPKVRDRELRGIVEAQTRKLAVEIAENNNMIKRSDKSDTIVIEETDNDQIKQWIKAKESTIQRQQSELLMLKNPVK